MITSTFPYECLAKADYELRSRLQSSAQDEVLRVVLLLRCCEPSSGSHIEELNPSDFDSRASYRAALIQNQQSRLSCIDETVKALEKLSRRLIGGVVSRFVVVEGYVWQILECLNHSEVLSGKLDEEIEIVDGEPMTF